MPVGDEDPATEDTEEQDDQIDRGSITFIDARPASEDPEGDSVPTGGTEADDDLFASEERRVVLVSIPDDVVDGLLAALSDWEIGARREQTEGGTVEILIHASNVLDAQAVLVEHFGDVRLVDDMGASDDLAGSDDSEASSDGYELLITTTLRDAGSQGNRLRDDGIDVRVEIRDPDDPSTAACALYVPAAHIERARRILGIKA